MCACITHARPAFPTVLPHSKLADDDDDDDDDDDGDDFSETAACCSAVGVSESGRGDATARAGAGEAAQRHRAADGAARVVGGESAQAPPGGDQRAQRPARTAQQTPQQVRTASLHFTSRYLPSSSKYTSGISHRLAFSSTSFGWCKGGNVTSAGWQVTLCDPMWHVSSRSGVATLRTAILLLLTYKCNVYSMQLTTVWEGAASHEVP